MIVKTFWTIQNSYPVISSINKLKSCLEFLINNSFFQVGSKIFRRVIGISMGSDPAPFFANLLFFYESRWLKSTKNTSYGVASKFGKTEKGKHLTQRLLHLCINEGKVQKSLYGKRSSYNFNVVKFPYKSSTIPSKMFFATISAEILRICWATSSVVQFIKTSKVFLHGMLRQEAVPLGVKKVLVKMINCHDSNLKNTKLTTDI